MGCNQGLDTSKFAKPKSGITGRFLQDVDDSLFSLTMEPGNYEGNEEVDLSTLEFVWEIENFDNFNNEFNI